MQRMKVEYDYSFGLLGIVASCKEYRICSELNKKLDIQLIRRDNLQIIKSAEGDKAEFSEYFYESEIDKSEYYLLANKSDGRYLIPERKEFDYLLIIKGELAKDQLPEIQEKLKEISVMQLVTDIDISKLKSKENLVIE